MNFAALPYSATNPAFNSGWGVLGGPQVMEPMTPQQVNPIAAPQFGSIVPESKGWFGIDGLGKNMDTLRLGLGGVQTVGNLWGAWQASRLARDQFNFTKDVTNTNLNNQVKSYNTALEDRMRSRAVVEGLTPAQVDDYLNRNRASRG